MHSSTVSTHPARDQRDRRRRTNKDGRRCIDEKKARTEYGLFDEWVSDDVLLSRARAHYHRRKSVSRSCSGWEGVVPLRYGRQTKLVGGEPGELPRLAADV